MRIGHPLVAIASMVAAIAVASPALAAPHTPSGTAFYTPPSPIPGKHHGDLIWARPVSGGPKLANASSNELVLYRSTSTAGKPVAVSGTVAIPKGKAPKGGWPVITWAHGTTGIADACAPSRLGNPATSPLQDTWLKAGYAVVNTDYEGLGTPGTHPYLIGESEGRSVLDIVRAARQKYHQLSNKVVISGHSQGGHAALWAADLAPSWTPDLNVRGTVAFAPVSHLEDQLPLFTNLSTAGVTPLLAEIVRGVDVADPAAHVSALMTPRAAALYPRTLTQCMLKLHGADAFGGLPANQFFPRSANLAPVTRVLRANDEAYLHIPTPVLIEQGLSDTTVLPGITKTMQAGFASRGVRSTLHTYPGVTHLSVIAGAPAADATSYIEKLLPGRQASASIARGQAV
jgi:pimeloyl-ACP methyl ester carboxylesterase